MEKGIMSQRLWIVGLSIAIAASCAIAKEGRGKRAKDCEVKAAATAPSKADDLEGIRSVVYKKVGDVELKLYICTPPGHKPTDKRPAIVFFFGGGWQVGSPGQFMPQCKYFASRGMFAAAADYRVFTRHKAMVADCTADAESAIRWVRVHAKELGVDPERIVASGGSAGGHLAAATGTVKDFTGDKDTSVSFRPNAMVLFNPVIDLTRDKPVSVERAEKRAGIVARLGAKPEELSPMDHVKAGVPATIVFHGKQDPSIPFAKIEEFGKVMKAAGNRCEVVGFEGQKHGFFNPGKGNGNKCFVETLQLADRFLASLGYLKGEPTADKIIAEKSGGRPY
jgi:acetyl esterase/lipase